MGGKVTLSLDWPTGRPVAYPFAALAVTLSFMSLPTAVSADDLGVHAWSDRCYEALMEREGDRREGTCVLATDESWDFDRVLEGWLTHLRDQLAQHGILYDLENDQIELPPSLALDEARRLCGDSVSGFLAWIEGVVDEVRAGRPDSPEWDARSQDDAGSRWVKWNPE
ncbi:hypothetical protein ACIPJN_29985 [Streptomyces sp. NPDC086796]|uniref:hypothetical protein n=1 Tax=Streptomyces sp. NPDC086796 TaxID=3365760 RepID=UPI003806FEE3